MTPESKALTYAIFDVVGHARTPTNIEVSSIVNRLDNAGYIIVEKGTLNEAWQEGYRAGINDTHDEFGSEGWDA